MVRGIYYDDCQDHRLLSVEEIAKASHLAPQKVHQLIKSRILPPASEDEKRVTVSNVLWFLLKNNMVIPLSLLPPGTGKILFVTDNSLTLFKKEKVIDSICHIFAESCSLALAESVMIGPQADLTIMTFSPNVVVIIVTEYTQKLKSTLDLLASMTNVKIILLVDSTSELVYNIERVNMPIDLIISCDVSVEQLSDSLQSLFGV